MARSRSRQTRLLARYGGLAVIALVLIGWGRLDPTVMIPLLLLTAAYLGAGVPTWCGAITRGQRICRNNAHGLLLGCHLREHKWQKLRLAIVPKAWAALLGTMWRTDQIQTTGLVIALATAAFTGLQVAATMLT